MATRSERRLCAPIALDQICVKSMNCKENSHEPSGNAILSVRACQGECFFLLRPLHVHCVFDPKRASHCEPLQVVVLEPVCPGLTSGRSIHWAGLPKGGESAKLTSLGYLVAVS